MRALNMLCSPEACSEAVSLEDVAMVVDAAEVSVVEVAPPPDMSGVAAVDAGTVKAVAVDAGTVEAAALVTVVKETVVPAGPPRSRMDGSAAFTARWTAASIARCHSTGGGGS